MRKWTTEEDEIIIFEGKHLSAYELNELLPDKTPATIRSRKSKYGIRLEKESYSRIISEGKLILSQCFDFDDLDYSTLQILLGMIIGNGCFAKCSNGFLLTEDKKLDRFNEYIEWKAMMLKKDFRANLTPKYKLTTPAHKIFEKIRKDCYTGQHKTKGKDFFPIEYAQKMDCLAFLIWYLDDGSITCNNHMYIAIRKLSANNVNEIVDILNKNLQLNLAIRNRGYDCKILITGKTRDKLQSIWFGLFDKYNIPESVKYKIIPIRKNKEWNNLSDYEMSVICNENLLITEVAEILKRDYESVRHYRRKFGTKITQEARIRLSNLANEKQKQDRKDYIRQLFSIKLPI